MARLTEEKKEDILNQFHLGKSQYRLSKDFEVSPATINKLVKGLTPKYKNKVNEAVALKTELAHESESLVKAFDKEVDKKAKQLIFFQNSALRNQQLANKRLDDDTSLSDLKDHSQITAKNKETVLGKDADININNTNTQETKAIRFVKIGS